MLRSSIALIVAIYAIGFALAALTAVRWPSLLMVAAFLGESGNTLQDVQALVGWRELGLAYGLAYLTAAFFFYSASTLISRAGRGSVVCYVFGAGIGFPPFLFFDFEPGWWQQPDTFEQVILAASVLTAILFSAVLELSGQKQSLKKETVEPDTLLLTQKTTPIRANVPTRVFVQERSDQMNVVPAQKRHRKPVPAAIARQRASFAAHGRRARARQLR
jgi:hypothetical protein